MQEKNGWVNKIINKKSNKKYNSLNKELSKIKMSEILGIKPKNYKKQDSDLFLKIIYEIEKTR